MGVTIVTSELETWGICGRRDAYFILHMCKNTIWLPVSQILRLTAQNSPSYSFFFTAALTVKIFPPLARARPALQINLVFYAYLGTVAVRLYRHQWKKAA